MAEVLLNATLKENKSEQFEVLIDLEVDSDTVRKVTIVNQDGEVVDEFSSLEEAREKYLVF